METSLGLLLTSTLLQTLGLANITSEIEFEAQVVFEGVEVKR